MGRDLCQWNIYRYYKLYHFSRSVCFEMTYVLNHCYIREKVCTIKIIKFYSFLESNKRWVL